MHRVKVYSEKGPPVRKGKGLFSAAFQIAFPLLPIEDEGRLHNRLIRENFIEQLFGYRRWKALAGNKRISRGTIVDFHARHKYVLLAHSRAHYAALGKLVSTAEQYRPSNFAKQYGEGFMETLKIKTTVNKHANVLKHLTGHIQKHLQETERTELQENILNYQRQLIPLGVPLTLIKHYVRRLPILSLIDQVYLNPHPQELILRNQT